MALTKVPKVRKRRLPSGKTAYFLDYTIDGVRHRETIGPRKVDAERRAAKVFSDYQKGSAGIHQAGDTQLDLVSVVEAFLKSKDRRTSGATLKRYRIYRDHFLQFFQTNLPRVISVDQIRKAHLDEHINDLAQSGKANKTLNGQVHFIKTIFKYAVDEGLIRESPALRIRPFPERKDEKPPYWTVEEVRQILETVQSTYRDTFEFLYNTGLRKGELINLTWDDVQLGTDPPCIVISGKEDWRTKTNRSRSVPLNQPAQVILHRQVKSEKHDFVFSGPKGGQIHRDRIYTALKRALVSLGLTGDVHQWRHTFASHLVMNGVGIETVSRLLGHATIEMTMRYAHLAPDYLKRAVDQLPVLSPPE